MRASPPTRRPSLTPSCDFYDEVSRTYLLFLAFFERDLISVGKRDLLQISILRPVDGCHNLDRHGLADGRREIRAIDADLGKPSGRIALELPIYDVAVISLCVHEHHDVRIHPIHLGDGAF